MPITLRPENRLIWNFFWSMDALDSHFAEHHFSPMRFSSEWEKGRFFESIYYLKNTVERLRNEAVNNAAKNREI